MECNKVIWQRTSPNKSPCTSGKFVTSDKSVCRILSWISTPWLTASLMVFIMSGTADCGTALSAMSRWREPREMAIILAFLVAQPMKTGRRRSVDWGLSAWVAWLIGIRQTDGQTVMGWMEGRTGC
jgi:hypothetical protein